jgi:hypothetical protein
VCDFDHGPIELHITGRDKQYDEWQDIEKFSEGATRDAELARRAKVTSDRAFVDSHDTIGSAIAAAIDRDGEVSMRWLLGVFNVDDI